MIEPAIALDLGRIAASERDVRGAFQPGFLPESNVVARPSKVARSDDPLSVAAPEGAYFLSADVSGKITFSRDGAFSVRDGELRAPDGSPVLGFAIGEHRKVAALRVDRYDAALGHFANARIERDGTFAYTRISVDPRSGERRAERVTVGRLALGRFPAGTQPDRIGSAHVRPPEGVTPEVGVPDEGRFKALATYSRDLGRVDIVAGLEKMKEAYVAYEALRSAHHVHGSLEKTAMDLVK
ncbi:MAG: hypothetical protein M3R53_05995 [Candidatus Eremiobacteraeota bacterium]|nr:hypothetical protein [Candidatus Eremiobacteraeota bacterium]